MHVSNSQPDPKLNRSAKIHFIDLLSAIKGQLFSKKSSL